MENKSSVDFHGFSSGDAGGPIDCRGDDICNHVGFTDVTVPRGSWRHFKEKNSLDSRLRKGTERTYI
jgi:hypothetical protein